MLTSLATDEPDPVRRLRAINASTVAAKAQLNLIPADVLQDFTQFAPPAVAAQASRLLVRFSHAQRFNLPYNVAISNVPGPREPLYLAGAELKHLYPVSMITNGMGLNMTVTSYRDGLDFGLSRAGSSSPTCTGSASTSPTPSRSWWRRSERRPQTGGQPRRAGCQTLAMIERQVEVTTPDGEMTTFVFHPEQDGPHPVVLYLMDAPSIRPALRDMASRLATAGYYVLLPYLYYRGGPYREFGSSDEDMHARQDLMGTITPTNCVGDAEALLAHAATDPAAGSGPVGAVGFCMSGGLVVSLARALPRRVAAVASIHGAWLVREGPDSPHLDLDRVRAEVHFAWVEGDPTAPAEDLAVMRQALDEAGVRYTLDLVTGAEHGFAPPGPRYDRTASERHWERVHSLLRRNLWTAAPA